MVAAPAGGRQKSCGGAASGRATLGGNLPRRLEEDPRVLAGVRDARERRNRQGILTRVRNDGTGDRERGVRPNQE